MGYYDSVDKEYDSLSDAIKDGYDSESFYCTALNHYIKLREVFYGNVLKGSKELASGLWKRARREVPFAIEALCWIENPKSETDRRQPFRLWKRQAEMLKWIHRFQNGSYTGDKVIAITKSREIGASWCLMAYVAVLCLLSPEPLRIGIASNKLENISAKGPNSLFGRLCYQFESWNNKFIKLPQRYRTMKQLEIPVVGTNNKLFHNIDAISGNDDSYARSRRYNIFIGDEIAFIDHVEQKMQGATSLAKLQICCSTINEPLDWFDRLLMRLPKEQVFEYAHTSDPTKAWRGWFNMMKRSTGKSEAELKHEYFMEHKSSNKNSISNKENRLSEVEYIQAQREQMGIPLEL